MNESNREITVAARNQFRAVILVASNATRTMDCDVNHVIIYCFNRI